MSSGIAVFTKEVLYMGADSATCCQHSDGEFYRVNDFTEKLYRIDNKLIFLCGVEEVVNEVIYAYKTCPVKNIDTLKTSMEALYMFYKMKYLDIADNYRLGALVGSWENKPVVYSIDSNSNFEISKHIADEYGEVYLLAEGTKKQELTEKMTYYHNKLHVGHANHKGSILNVIINSYDDIACEEIGGWLTVSGIQDGNIFEKLVYRPIKEKPNLRRISDIDVVNSIVEQQIKDDQGRVRAILGNYDPNNGTGKYGLLLKNKTGTSTILDEDGIENVYSFVVQDNLDSANSLTIPFYVDGGTSEVRECKVNIMLDNFRAYSKAASSGGGATSSSGGSHRHVMYSKYNGGGLYNYNQGLYQFPSVGDGSAVLGLSLQIADFNGVLPNGAFPSNIYTLESAGSHSHTVPNHTHGIDYGIFKGSKASNCSVIVNTHQISSGINNNTEVDIAPYVNVGWNTLEITSGSLGRIVASVFLKLFVTT